jgi:hypothetical protein
MEAKSAEPKAAKKPGGLQWMPHEIHLSELSFLRKIYAPPQFNATKNCGGQKLWEDILERCLHLPSSSQPGAIQRL